MEQVPIPRLTLNFSVELEIDYNPFKGKTQAEYIKYIENELQETLFDVSPNVKNVYTSLIAIDENDKQSK
jgi:hypothetical protein|tara:strand:+ start:10833 stop:11042 length:210 start_codon:yes stop_codon:yes gene_type:complete